MSLKISSGTVDALYVGASAVDRVYLGASLVDTGGGGGGDNNGDDEMTLISSGLKSSAKHWEFDLPLGYDYFDITIPRLRLDIADYVAAVFSPDTSGENFYFDASGNQNYYKISYEKFESGSVFQSEGGATYMYAGHTFADGDLDDSLGGSLLKILIYPGSASQYPGLKADCACMHPHRAGWFKSSNSGILDVDNSVDTIGRQRRVRLFAVGNADTMTNSTGTLLDANYFLRGEPAP
jgi:hypothetical protein